MKHPTQEFLLEYLKSNGETPQYELRRVLNRARAKDDQDPISNQRMDALRKRMSRKRMNRHKKISLPKMITARKLKGFWHWKLI